MCVVFQPDICCFKFDVVISVFGIFTVKIGGNEALLVLFLPSKKIAFQ